MACTFPSVLLAQSSVRLIIKLNEISDHKKYTGDHALLHRESSCKNKDLLRCFTSEYNVVSIQTPPNLQYLSQTMHVTQIVNDEFPSDGGYQNLVTNVVRHMADREEVTNEVVCLSSSKDEASFVKIYPILASPGTSKASVLLTIMYNWIVLTWYLLKSRPDVIHAHQAFIAGVYCWPVKIFRTKLVCTSHGSDVLIDKTNSYGSRRKVHRRILIFITLKLVDRHIVVSESMRTHAIDAGSSRSKIRVIYNGLDLTNIEERNENPVAFSSSNFNILFIGRLIKVKRPELLIRALNMIISEKSDIKLHYAGTGPMQDQLKQLTSKNGVNHAVTFHGYVSGLQKWNMFHQSDLVVLPSDTEAFGLVLIEAMACGTPVMAPDHGPFPEIITHLEDGILYDTNSPDSLAQAISMLHEDNDLRNRLGTNGKQTVDQRFTVKHCVDDHLSLYKKMKSSN